MSKMLDSMSEELGNVQFKLSAAREKAATANALVDSLEREERALQAAIDILAGNEPKTPAPVETKLDQKVILEALARISPQVAVEHALAATPSLPGGKGPMGVMPKHDIVFNAPEGWSKGILNGDEVLLEPGMAVMKNSFGEDVIAKIGTVFMPAVEPTVPVAPLDFLAPIDEEEGFESIESQLDGA